MALAKHHEEIGEKILSNLEIDEGDPELKALLDKLNKKYGGLIGGVVDDYQTRKPQRQWSSRQKISHILGLLVGENRKREKLLEDYRHEIRRLISNEVIYKRLCRKSPLVRELDLEIAQLRNEIRILRKRDGR